MQHNDVYVHVYTHVHVRVHVTIQGRALETDIKKEVDSNPLT